MTYCDLKKAYFIKRHIFSGLIDHKCHGQRHRWTASKWASLHRVTIIPQILNSGHQKRTRPRSLQKGHRPLKTATRRSSRLLRTRCHRGPNSRLCQPLAAVRKHSFWHGKQELPPRHHHQSFLRPAVPHPSQEPLHRGRNPHFRPRRGLLHAGLQRLPPDLLSRPHQVLRDLHAGRLRDRRHEGAAAPEPHLHPGTTGDLLQAKVRAVRGGHWQDDQRQDDRKGQPADLWAGLLEPLAEDAEGQLLFDGEEDAGRDT